MTHQDRKSRAYRYIDSHQQLAELCSRLSDQSDLTWLAIDTEFVRVDTYYPQLSLVQIATQERDFYLIDPLAIETSYQDASANEASALRPLVDLLQNERICKVFHSARQDIEVLYQLESRMPQNLFDTQIAAIFLGHGDLAGFARVIEAELNIKLPKSQTRTNWHARPLSEEQIEYALDDVDYLASLYQKCLQTLGDDELHAVTEDCQQLLQPQLYDLEPEKAWLKLKGLKRFNPKQLAIVQILAQWREEYAVEHNQPKKWTLSDEVLLQIAKRPPKTVQALYKVPNIKTSSVREFGETWIALIDRVFEQNPESYPTLPKAGKHPSAQEEILLALTQSVCQQISLQYKVQLSNLSSKEELLTLIRHPHQSPWSGWRHLLIGIPLQKLLEGRASLKLEGQEIRIQ
ncbi:ribonuclease D [Thiomicrorhabdus xiamenensis]|uniref:Ribonuclease D n=1 Tax=Thiomicrorhabdus xiamenensis TaxID=2739063 RepID=A0A7D4T0X2_9GAMM|nr:ribonuclease D [Thiomicrorhabdus xiamenensis]QKI89482.1 ribonuclease D [Thiomicrorhabdus xiamenensis]